MMAAMDLETALPLAQALAALAGSQVIGYWQDEDADQPVIIFALDPPPASDALLVAQGDDLDWEPYGPINEADQWDYLLDEDPTPLPAPEASPGVPADDSAAGPLEETPDEPPADAPVDAPAETGDDEVTRLRLLADALHGDEDTPADVLARIDADLAAAEGNAG